MSMGGETVCVGMTKAIYVREEDVELWERAERWARARRMPMSGLIMTALERFLDNPDGDSTP